MLPGRILMILVMIIQSIRWISATFFVMNLIRFGKEFLFSFLKEALSSLFSVSDIFILRQNEFMLSKTK